MLHLAVCGTWFIRVQKAKKMSSCGIPSQPSLLTTYLSMLSYGRDPRGGGHYQLSFTSLPWKTLAFLLRRPRLRWSHDDASLSHPLLTNEHQPCWWWGIFLFVAFQKCALLVHYIKNGLFHMWMISATPDRLPHSVVQVQWDFVCLAHGRG